MKYFPDIKDIKRVKKRIKHISLSTPLQYNEVCSSELNANVWFKREDLQKIRSYKIRGSYNKMSSLSKKELNEGVVCASAGNHAQGVALSAKTLNTIATVFMPCTTPKQKVEQVKWFGKENVKVILDGDTFDHSYILAKDFAIINNKTFVHPFDDPKIIEGQGTIGLEILNETKENIDYLFLPVGGGGVLSGVGAVFHHLSPSTKIIGVEPEGAPSMSKSIKQNGIVELQQIDRFVDGAAVKQVGELNFTIAKKILNKIITVPEGALCDHILKLYNKEAIVAEPAGVLGLAGMYELKDELKGKNIVCLISGGNNDITRMEEIKERALLHNKLKHYFIIQFPQRAGALKEFVAEVLGPNDDITHFEYTKKHSRDKGTAVVGIECLNKDELEPLVKKMKEKGFYRDYLNNKQDIRQILI